MTTRSVAVAKSGTRYRRPKQAYPDEIEVGLLCLDVAPTGS